MRKHTQAEEYPSKGPSSPAPCFSTKSLHHPERLRHAWKGPVFVSSPLHGTIQPTELTDITLQLSFIPYLLFSLWLDHTTHGISAGMEVSPPAVGMLGHRTISQVEVLDHHVSLPSCIFTPSLQFIPQTCSNLLHLEKPCTFHTLPACEPQLQMAPPMCCSLHGTIP